MSETDLSSVMKPSDTVPAILDAGDGGITTLFMSMAERHPEGQDADYLRWHTLDHRPEQHRLASLRASLRLVSAPECRQARAFSDKGFDAIDHVMAYFFADKQGLETFSELSGALREAGRSPFILRPVQRGVYAVADKLVAAQVRIGADVLPWFPARGVYLLIEQGEVSTPSLTDVSGVAGVWVARSVPSRFSTAGASQQGTVCFLEDDPVDVAQRLRPTLEMRWSNSGIQPLLAAPFYTVVPHEWHRYLP